MFYIAPGRTIAGRGATKLWTPIASAGGGGGGASNILDTLGLTAKAAFSTRKLRSAYAGSALQVRRSSDNTTLDIGFDGSGNLDTAALATFVGANSAFVSKWYDQSGAGADAVNATQANQPRLVNAGANDTLNSKPAVRFTANTQQLLSPASASYTSAILWNAVASVASLAAVNPLIGSGSASASGFELRINTSGGIDFLQQGSAALSISSGFTIVTGAQHIIEADYDSVPGTGPTHTIADGTVYSTNNSGAGIPVNAGTVYLGANGADAGPLATIAEVFIFDLPGGSGGLSAGNRTTLHTDQKAYWGTP
jgi:hypothetical protein